MKVVLQQANTLTGEYDVHKSRPYPIVVDLATGNVESGVDAGAVLIGFQATVAPDPIGIITRGRVSDLDGILGMFPVFGDDQGMWNSTLPIESARQIKEN